MAKEDRNSQEIHLSTAHHSSERTSMMGRFQWCMVAGTQAGEGGGTVGVVEGH